ncbi:MAG: BON domain-containing protein [Chloroflexota bacterium]
MSGNQDIELKQQLSTRMSQFGLPLSIDVRDGTARLTGAVSSNEDYQAALDLVSSVEGIIGVQDEIEISTIAPDQAFDDVPAAQGFDFAENPATGDLDGFEYEADLTEDVGAGTRDFQESVEEAEPYVPPTDPVVKPSADDQELDITGGVQDTSMDEVAAEPELDAVREEPASPMAGRRDDETIREDVSRELREDASTSNLDIDVIVLNGTVVLRGQVTDLDDSYNAEEVARRVPGVLDVNDETTLDQDSL